MAIRTACNCLASLNPNHYLGKTTLCVGAAMMAIGYVAMRLSTDRTSHKRDHTNLTHSQKFSNIFLDSKSTFSRITQIALTFLGGILIATSAAKILFEAFPIDIS